MYTCSGEIIKMTDRMTMMFEAEDLEQARTKTRTQHIHNYTHISTHVFKVTKMCHTLHTYFGQASPATVSRVGMIFCETQNLGWRPLRKVLASAG